MLTNLKAKALPFFLQLNKATAMYEVINPASVMKFTRFTPAGSILNNNKCIKFHYLDSFSTYFNELDEKDVQQYSEKKYQNKKYRGLIDLWKKPLERKKKRQERIKQIKAELPVIFWFI